MNMYSLNICDDLISFSSMTNISHLLQLSHSQRTIYFIDQHDDYELFSLPRSGLTTILYDPDFSMSTMI